ncbi:sugar lactone lactonase YvrE [Sphingobium sp. JAI105]|uniref:SMP-30/gluconolactonase/LRE family protein n=1 Tax=Sphingobium sp. JAI105 TaxID=2787715 RepID=UPI0018CACC8E|nr:SMP-30/gluconolactonase/LRE family protein [Sphingobium sp. JAI105]MBG6118482.1 sugar lactone lactonase YvrE [Sphingobium sp. JAI105]
MSTNPLKGWSVDPAQIVMVGEDLQRPECILAERDGTIWSADARGGVMRIAADGQQQLISQKQAGAFDLNADPAASLLTGTLPNGLAFAPNGDFLIANFGTDRLELMDRSGQTSVLFEDIDGKWLGKVNFVLRDSKNRLWITISTKINPWSDAICKSVCDGAIVLMDEKGPRVVAEGLYFTNELRLDAGEEWLYVAETTAKRVSRFKVTADGLGPRETYGPSDLGRGLIDGIAFDAAGNLWAAMVFADRLVAITPDGDAIELLNDGDAAATDAFEAEFASGKAVSFETLYATGGTICPWLASITFGGADLQTVMLGGLRASRIPTFRSPVPGLPMIHW